MTNLKDQNLGSFILATTDTFLERPAFIIKEGASRRPLSYFEFNELIRKITVDLKNRYPQPGFKIGLLGENRMEWCALAIAIWSAGGVLVPLMHIATDQEIKNVIDAARLDGLFISPKLGKKDTYGLKNVFSMDMAPNRGQGPRPSLGDLIAEFKVPSKEKETPQRGGDDLAILIFTSGTTGNPKGVMLTHKNIITNLQDTFHVIPTTKDDRAISVLPLSHLFELVAGFCICHLKGICIAYPDSLKPEDVLGEMKAHRATILVAVPLFFEIIDRAIADRMSQLPSGTRKALAVLGNLTKIAPFLGPIVFKKVHQIFGGHVRLFATGGAKINPEIILRFERLGIHFLQGYGLTETSPIITFTPLGSDKFASVGIPVKSIQLKIIDGEICVSGPSVFKGYFNNPEATADVIKEGWFHTGDLGEVDDGGFVYITGRKKDVIVTANGKNIYPEELEEALKTSPLFSEIAILGLDSGRGEEVHAVAVPSPAAPQDPIIQRQVLWGEIERIGENFSDYKRVKGMTISHVDLPKTATKKVRKHILKNLIQQGHFKSGGVATAVSQGPKTALDSKNQKESWLSQKLQDISKKSEIWKEAHLRQDLGIDSLTFMEIISSVETQWGVRIADEDLPRVLTVDDILKKLGETNTQVEKKTAKEFNYRRNNSFYMKFLRLFVHGVLIRPVLRIFFRFRVFNKKGIQASQNLVITPNHASHLDLLTVLATIPLSRVNSTYAVAADDYFFNHPLKAFMVRLLFNAIPFERRARIDKGFKVCEDILRDGGSLIIFPEGTRSPTGQMSDFKPGVGRLLAAQGYAAIPIYIKGAHEAYPKGALLPRPRPLSVHVGLPVGFRSLTPDLKSYQIVASQLQEAVANLRSKSQM
jgi:long-chain acyl-CoA synthetase